MTVPEVSERATPPPDFRLAVGGLAAWLAVLAAIGLPAVVSVAAGLAALTVAGGLLLVGPRRTAVLALALGCAGGAALATSARVGAADSSPLTDLAQDRASVSVELVVTDDPRSLRSGGPGGHRVSVAARAERVTASGRSWTLGDRLLVLAPADTWRGLQPSQRLRADGRLTPPLRDDLTVGVLSVRGAPKDVGRPSSVQRAAGHIRSGLRDAARVLPPGPRGLLPGLVLGDTSGLDPGLADDFRTAGLTHLVAVSGTNCTIVTGAVLLLLRLATVGPRTSAVLAGAALVGFVIVARPSPSVLRAAVMGGIALLALATGRARTALPALGAAVLGLVIASPPLARDPGFALSVLATLGLLLLAPGWAARLRRRGVPPGIAEALVVPAAAAVTTAPVIAALSGSISLVSIPANLLAAPAVAPATVLGVLAALVSPVSSVAAEWLVRIAGIPVRWLAAVGETAAGVPGGTMTWPGGATGGLALAGAALAAALLVRHRGLRRVTLAAAVGAVIVAVPTRVVSPGWPPSGWLLVACDVGQGDALAVAAGPGAAVVVDSGPEPTAVDGCLRRLGVRAVPLLVVSHLHADHVGGLDGVARGRTVAEIDVGPSHDPADGWSVVQRVASRTGAPVHTVSLGERREVAGVQLDVLAPVRTFHGSRSDPNNDSIVLRVRTAGRTLLLTGDVEVEAQEAIVGTGADLRADVLKVPHHGSAFQFPAFLAAVHAPVGIVSVGVDNDYGHPSPLLSAELARLGTAVSRTDRDGDVAVAERNGETVVVARSREPP
jgi:competence protein ComEC